MDRRTVLKSAAGLATGCVLGANPMSQALGADVPPGGYIDAHSHIWTRDVAKYPLSEGKSVADLNPASFTAEELLALAKPERVERIVLICHHPYYGFDNSYLIDTAARYRDTFRIVGALDDRQPGAGAQMRELLRQRVTGFRITPLFSNEQWLESPGMDEMWRTGAETRQAMCCLINPSNLPQVLKMCERHRDTPVVIDHFARIGMTGEIRRQDLDQLCMLARFESTYIKISAFYALGAKKPPYHDLVPMIKRLYDRFGPERLMWASDSPYQVVGEHTYRASISLVRDHLNFLSEKDRDWLLFRTAEKVFYFA